MAQNEPQSYSNHTRFHAPYHFILTPVLLLVLVGAVIRLYLEPGFDTVFGFLLAVALMLTVALLRIYPLKVQDRVIRLEEMLRLQSLLDEPLRSRIGELKARHLVALRFASDEDAPELVQRILAGELSSGKEIKQAIRHWRADYFRV